MALLGAQLVITLIMVSVIQKLSPHFSLAKWMLCSTGLLRFLHPSDTQLKTLAGVPKFSGPKPKHNNKNRHQNGHHQTAAVPPPDTTFHVPRNLDIQLETVRIQELDLVHLRYYTEYQWLVDYSLYAGIVYVLSEVYQYFYPLRDEVNLSMMWCLMVVFFAFKLLSSLTIQYFRSDESIGERSTCIVTGLVYLLISMVILIVDERMLETGLEQAYRSFNETATVFMEAQPGISTSGPASAIIVKFCIAVTCGVVGAIFTFPGLRMARMHWDSLKYCQDNRLLQALLNVSFALPFILVLLWVRPLSKDYLTGHVFGDMKEPLLTERAFDAIRLVLVVVAVLLRLCLMPVYLQAYLNIAYDRLEEQKKEAGRITNVELQRKIASIFYYLCVVTLQYVAPIILCLYVALMYKTLGGYRWTDLYRWTHAATGVGHDECGLDQVESAADQLRALFAESRRSAGGEELVDGVEDGLLVQARMSLDGLKAVFTTDVYRGLFGFATWWSCFVWFATSSLGMVYQTYFTKL